MKKNNLRFLCIILGCFFVLALCIGLSLRDKDRIFMSVTGKQLAQTGISDYVIDPETDALYITALSGKKATLSTKDLYLLPGEYHINIQYESFSDDTELVLQSKNYVDGANKSGKIYYSSKLLSGEPWVKEDFCITEVVDDLEILIVTKDPAFAISHIDISSNKPIYNDSFALIALLFIISLVYLFLYYKPYASHKSFSISEIHFNKQQYNLALFTILLLGALVASLPCLYEHLFIGFDAQFHLDRIEGIKRSLLSGQFPVRLHADFLNGYGYPNSLFYPELFLYLPALLSVLGVSVFNAYKFFIFFINFFTLLMGYLAFGKLLHSRLFGLVASIVYSLSLFRIATIYSNGALGMFLAMAFLPPVLYGLYAVLWGDKSDWPLLALSACGVLQSHILSTEIVAFFAMCICLFGFKNLFGKEKRIFPLLLALFSVIIINAWFLIPFFLMAMQLKISIMLRDYSLARYATTELYNLFRMDYAPAYNKGGILTLPSLGPLLLIGTGAFLLFLLLNKTSKERTFLHLGKVCLIIGCVFAFMTTALFPWDFIHSVKGLSMVAGVLQFPQRLLIISILCFSVLITVCIKLWFSQKKQIYASIFVILLSVFISLFYYKGIPDTTGYYENFQTYFDTGLCISLGEYITAGVDNNENLGAPPFITAETNDIEFYDRQSNGTTMSFGYRLASPSAETKIIAPFTYIPNYEITVDGKKVDTLKYAGAKVAFVTPSPSGHVVIKYKEPLVFRFCELVSFLGFIALVIFYCSQRKMLHNE